MRIGELAEQTGVSVRSLRYYEEQDLILPTRTQGGQRTFPPDAVERVHLIQILLAAGIPSRRIAEIMPCMHTGQITPAMFDHLTAERDRIDEQMSTLAATRDRLDGVIEAARERLTAESVPA
ncbi:MerR family transcriptional regulator [Actinoplanes sp. NPDC051470]|uniref:MerR family transcriptional regulator n=1 Tax=Actinoplanes sp. NPDC051470 TaxID=3157224 RepID=UPI00341EE823